MVDFTSDTLLGDIRRCILKKKMDLGNIGGFRVPKKALFSGFQPFFGHFKGPEWCQTKIQGHATPAERSPMIAERICGFWFQGSFVQIMAHCAVVRTRHDRSHGALIIVYYLTPVQSSNQFHLGFNPH